ncbi:protein of unknown function [Brevefilum fermentans]|uniref:Uncharacterized protein n=1 Tax=Candidatus Brevifilum fermentans TaxID=1986204 RepID=A0A1Y6K2Y9_9CHLR|nr:protein of unknown function [Brevefilum fermentans]
MKQFYSVVVSPRPSGQGEIQNEPFGALKREGSIKLVHGLCVQVVKYKMSPSGH